MNRGEELLSLGCGNSLDHKTRTTKSKKHNSNLFVLASKYHINNLGGNDRNYRYK